METMSEDRDRPHDPAAIPGDRPPRRLLERAPGERLAAAAASPAGLSDTGSSRRALAWGIAAAAAGGAAHLLAAALLLWTGGLLVVATTAGIATGLAVGAGGGASLAPARRRGLAAGLALLALAAALGAGWAGSGRYLAPLDYLWQVYGLLVPLQVALAAAGAVGGAR